MQRFSMPGQQITTRPQTAQYRFKHTNLRGQVAVNDYIAKKDNIERPDPARQIDQIQRKNRDALAQASLDEQASPVLFGAAQALASAIHPGNLPAWPQRLHAVTRSAQAAPA